MIFLGFLPVLDVGLEMLEMCFGDESNLQHLSSPSFLFSFFQIPNLQAWKRILSNPTIWTNWNSTR